MKKRFCVLMAAVLCIGVAAAVLCLRPARGDISQAEIDYGDSQFFTLRERQDAASALMKAFQREFPDYVLTRIWYVNDLRMLEDDSKLDTDYDVRRIILYADMVRKQSAADGDLPGKMLRYQWCMGQNDAGRWYLLEHGYFSMPDAAG